MKNSDSVACARQRRNLYYHLPLITAMLVLFTSASVWAQSSTVTFSGFGDSTAVYQVDGLCKTPRPDLAGTNGVNNWEQWCYNITSQDNTSSEFTHFGVVIDTSQHQNDSGIKSTIQSSMTVSPNDGDYDKDFKTSGGPLNSELGAPHVLWNNQQDHVTSAGESALFCYATPATGLSTTTVGLKVGGVRQSAQLQSGSGVSVATFEVNKVWDDGNPGPVTVHISCNDGLPLTSSKVIKQGQGVNFVVTQFEDRPLDCEVWEEDVTGYTPIYTATNGTNSVDGCSFENFSCGSHGVCDINNAPDPVDVDIEKIWNFRNSPQDRIDTDYQLDLVCSSEIVGGEPFGDDWIKIFNGSGDDTFMGQVIPNYPSSNCTVSENVFDDAVEVENGCGNLVVSAANGDSCTIINTVFFEGIPALNRYGLAVLALLIMGVGMVGFRRPG